MKILIVSDAWHPQVNGVVRTLENTIVGLEKLGHDVRVAGPEKTRFSFPAPSYPSIRLEFFARRRLRRMVEELAPDCIHIATEGPLGWSARSVCLQLEKPFTTSYHTRFPEYLAARAATPFRKGIFLMAYSAVRRFHGPSSAVMVATQSIENELRQRRFRHLARWSRGVDMDLFKPYDKQIEAFANLPRPISLYVGRVAVEKNLPAFFAVNIPGTKVVIGDGPDTQMLKAKYPQVLFLGPMEGERLARHYAAADLFVFPSSTDTFGLVLLEACAAGLRVASLPAPGPADIFAHEETKRFAVLDDDLEHAIHRALTLPENPELPRAFAHRFSWAACTQQFFQNLQAPTPKAVKRIGRFRRRLWSLLDTLGIEL